MKTNKPAEIKPHKRYLTSKKYHKLIFESGIRKIRQRVFEKLNWEERNYFVKLCEERDYMDKIFRDGFDRIDKRLNKLEK